MRVVKHDIQLVEKPEIGPDTLVMVELPGRHLALVHQGLNDYLRRTDADPRQWLDPERMTADIAFLLVQEALAGARSMGSYVVMLPVRCLAVVDLALRAAAERLAVRRSVDVEMILEQTQERIASAISIVRV